MFIVVRTLERSLNCSKKVQIAAGTSWTCPWKSAKSPKKLWSSQADSTSGTANIVRFAVRTKIHQVIKVGWDKIYATVNWVNMTWYPVKTHVKGETHNAMVAIWLVDAGGRRTTSRTSQNFASMRCVSAPGNGRRVAKTTLRRQDAQVETRSARRNQWDVACANKVDPTKPCYLRKRRRLLSEYNKSLVQTQKQWPTKYTKEIG